MRNTLDSHITVEAEAAVKWGDLYRGSMRRRQSARSRGARQPLSDVSRPVAECVKLAVGSTTSTTGMGLTAKKDKGCHHDTL